MAHVDPAGGCCTSSASGTAIDPAYLDLKLSRQYNFRTLLSLGATDF